MMANQPMSDARFMALMEIGTLALVALIAGVMAGLSIRSKDASGAAAWSALLMAIINTIKEARSSRTIDRMGQQLGTSTPGSGDATGKPGDPVHMVEEGK